MNEKENLKISVDPWELPLKDFIKSFKLVIIIYNLKNDDVLFTKQLDYGNPEDRKLLGKITFWAVNHGNSVETMALTDYEKTK